MMVVAASDPSGPPSPALAPAPAPAPFRPEGLYLHVPFCISLCPYCDFVVYAGSAARGSGSRVEAYTMAVVRELELRADGIDATIGAAGSDTALQSVYLGGGTPSLLPAAQIGRILALVDDRYGIAAGAEITLEANPGADEIGDLSAFKTAGVTRLSIGAQTMDAAELKRIGRRHAPADVVDAVVAARAAGIGSVSVDLLTDIPGQSVASWRRTLRRVLELAPDHLSVYALSLDDPDAEGLTGPDGDHLPVSSGARRWRERFREAQSQDRAAAMETLTDELVSTAGLERYEIANLARPGHRSRHNLLYWRRRPYLAVGPGAHASDGSSMRWWNNARLDAYLQALSAGRLPPGGSELASEAESVSESAILGLRLSDGIDEPLAADGRVAPALAWGRSAGLVEQHAGRTRLTARGRLLANEVFVRLLPASSADRAAGGDRLHDQR